MDKLKQFCKTLSENPICVKAFHTFWQAFLAVWIASSFKLDKVVLIAAVAAGLSAVKSVLVTSVKVAKS
ncbi:MAG: hypothetical protein QFB87_04450 [Patescibacteria group bacterium]|nr:hypothetical protein [Patescibacteria group bacterium]